MTHARTRILGALVLVATFGAGWASASLLHPVSKATPVRTKNKEYPLLNPQTAITYPAVSSFPELKKTERDVRAIIAEARSRGFIRDAGVYFRVPVNAHSFGIDADHGFHPGALEKTPLMVAYLKQAEADPGTLLRRYAFAPAHQDDDRLTDTLAPELKPGTYTAQELLETMIETPDIIAQGILAKHADPILLQDASDQLGLSAVSDTTTRITPRAFITIFSRLYDASYLDHENSNRALAFLTNTAYTAGLRAGVPSSVKVAHLYGEHRSYQDGTLVELDLHDCGIVYAPDNPYYLCVMVTGENPRRLSALIAEISAKVFANRATFMPTH